MNPWWLRPPSEEAPGPEEQAKKPAPKIQEEQQSETPEKKTAPGRGQSGRSRGGRRRRGPAAKNRRQTGDQRRIAVFFDAASLAGGVDLEALLGRLVDRGRVIAKRAYGDWGRYADQETELRAVGLEIFEFPKGQPTGQQSAEIKLAIDAVELCVSKEPCEVFVIISGNEDFSPLVAKLQQAKAEVVGIGDRETASAGLAKMCDEFLFFDELSQPTAPPPVANGVDTAMEPVFTALVETIKSLEPGADGIIWGSTLKQEMRRRQPELDIAGLGYATFTALLEDADRHKVIQLERDDRSGSYYVTGVAGQ